MISTGEKGRPGAVRGGLTEGAGKIKRIRGQYNAG
jgi:hypothetical protein